MLLSNWDTRPISDLTQVTKTTDPSTVFKESEFLYVDVSSVDNELYCISEPQRIRGVDAPSRARKVIRSGDVIFATIRPTLRRVARVSGDFDGQVCSTAFCVLRPKPNVVSEFLYFRLLCDDVCDFVRKIERGASYPAIRDTDLKSLVISFPDTHEQRQIARVLATVQRAIEQQQAIIATTRELKRSLMHKLFTEGLRGEAQKPTEIGLVPESWDVRPLGSLVAGIDYGTSIKCDYDKTGLPVLRIPNVEQGSINITDVKFSDLDETGLASQILSDGDLLFVRTNGVQENAGRCAVFHCEVEQASFASYLIRVRTAPDELNPDFLCYYCETKHGKRYLSGRASRTADGKFNINTGTIRTVMVPKPDLNEQNEIVAILVSVEEKLALLDARKTHYADLFKTLLHQLMTAQLRVHNLDLDALGVPALD